MGTDRHETNLTGGVPGGGGDAAWVVDLGSAQAADAVLAGGKGAGLARLAAIDGVTVAPGFCVTTDAFDASNAAAPDVGALIEALPAAGASDPAGLRARTAELRAAIEAMPVPEHVTAAITGALASRAARTAYAVRSSATAEDSAAASFAGQHDSFLGVVGPGAVMDHVRRVWASLFTDRAVTYRAESGVDHRSVRMAVVVQELVPAQVSGVLFTSDPLTSNRTVSSIEAVRGLGDALVSGRATPEVLRVRAGAVDPSTASAAAPSPALTDEQAIRLARLGRQIEAALGAPQDIEWCLVPSGFVVVQSRPITTLFPVPAADDDAPRVYVSVGHQQMMTDAMRPLGVSVHQLMAMATMHDAGGRLFVDATPALATQAGRTRLLETFGSSDPLTVDALRTVLEREDFIPPPHDASAPAGPPAPPTAPPAPVEASQAIVDELVAACRASLEQARPVIESAQGPELFAAIRSDVAAFKGVVFSPGSMAAITAAMQATLWLGEHLGSWLGERSASDVLTQSVPGNITSEMGLALFDVADVIRPHPEVVAHLGRASGDELLSGLTGLAGGPESRAAIEAFLDVHGMRCAGEIDCTRPRWSEDPRPLMPVLLGHVRGAAPGEGRRRFEEGRQRASAAADELLARLRELPGGAEKADETAAMIHRLRTFSGYREYPKYAIVSRYFLYKQALLREAGRLVERGVLGEPQDGFFLTLAELEEAGRTGGASWRALVRRREAEFRANEGLTTPRVLTSEGEALLGSYGRADAPAGALIGLAVSGGTVEGRARVITELGDADLGPGDILVTTFTDPGWTPVFAAVAGLVTEIGGLMTHGAVIAREYGLPAVVAVEGATRRIRDGQRIRVHGTDGYVELL